MSPAGLCPFPACPLPPSTEALFGQPPFASRSFTELEEKIRSNWVIEVGPSGPRSPWGAEEVRALKLETSQPPLQTRMWAQGYFVVLGILEAPFSSRDPDPQIVVQTQAQSSRSIIQGVEKNSN